jgi:hypothetical protein
MDGDTRLEQFEQKHGAGRVLRFKLGDGERLYFTVPSQQVHERFVEQSTMDRGANAAGTPYKAIALREYVLACLADDSPAERETVKAVLERWPGATDRIAQKIIAKATGDIEIEEKKD